MEQLLDSLLHTVQRNVRGVNIVYQQQRNYSLSQDILTCYPDVLFVDHLLALLKSCFNNGEKIILLIDMNNDLRRCSLVEDLDEIGIHSVI